MKIIWSLAIKNILNHRKKSFSALLSIASGFIALNLFQSYIYDVTLLFQSTYAERHMLGDLLIRKNNRYETLDLNQQQRIESFLRENGDSVDTFSRHLHFSGTANTGERQLFFLGLGYELEKGEKLRGPHWHQNAIYGQSLTTTSSELEISVGEGFSYQMGCRPENKLTLPIEKRGYHHGQIGFSCPFERLQLAVSTHSGQVNAIDTKVIGIQDGLFKEVDDRLVTTSLALAQKIMNTQEISYYSVKLTIASHLEKLKDLFKTQVQTQEKELYLDSWKNFEIGEFYQQSLSFLTLFRNFFSMIVISIGMLSVMATFYRLIYERRKEIGILRSIGLNKTFIFKLFLLESFLLSLGGILIGLIVSIFISILINHLSISYYLGMLTQPIAFGMTMNLSVILFTSITTAFISLIFSLFPVYRAMKLKVVDILCENN